MKIFILCTFFYFSNLSAEINCSSKREKILEVTEKSNKFGYHLKRRFLKKNRKIVLGTNQTCEMTDSMAKRQNVKCQITRFDVVKVNNRYCVCGRAEVVEKAQREKFRDNQCLILDEIHD